MAHCLRTPKTCGSCQDEPDSRDACMCGWGYLNGPGPILASQSFLLAGLLFSMAALGDCSFVELEGRLFLPPSLGLPTEIEQTRFVGFLTWQKLDGYCYWYNYGDNVGDQVDAYLDALGSGWQVARIFAGLSASLSLYAFLYLLSFMCSSQVKGFRYFTIFFITVVLTTFQGLTFVVFQSNFCDEEGCTFSRSAAWSVSAMVCLFLSGLCFVPTKDYPGDRWTGGDGGGGGGVAKVAPFDEYTSAGATAATSRGLDEGKVVDENVEQHDEEEQQQEAMMTTMPPVIEEEESNYDAKNEGGEDDEDDIIVEEEIVEWPTEQQQQQEQQHPDDDGDDDDDDNDFGTEGLDTEGAMYADADADKDEDEDEEGVEVEGILPHGSSFSEAV